MDTVNPIIFSWCSIPDHPGFRVMLQSCKSWGWPRVQPHFMPLDIDTVRFGTFAKRFNEWRQEGYTHACWIDAFDMVCVGPPSDLEAAFAAYGNPALLISAEAACWPGDYRLADYPPRQHPWWFAHSPLSVDLRQEPEKLIDAMPERGYGSDQCHFADLILDKVPGAAIDRDTRVVMATAHCHPWTDCFAVEGSRVRNKITGCQGLFVHGNGRTDISWAPVTHP